MSKLERRSLLPALLTSRKSLILLGTKCFFHKISYYGITGNLLNLIKDIYGETICAVKVGNESTKLFRCAKGVRQGCPLNPILFIMYIDDIFELVNQGKKPDIFLEVNALIYADNLIILSETKDGFRI